MTACAIFALSVWLHQPWSFQDSAELTQPVAHLDRDLATSVELTDLNHNLLYVGERVYLLAVFLTPSDRVTLYSLSTSTPDSWTQLATTSLPVDRVVFVIPQGADQLRLKIEPSKATPRPRLHEVVTLHAGMGFMVRRDELLVGANNPVLSDVESAWGGLETPYALSGVMFSKRGEALWYPEAGGRLRINGISASVRIEPEAGIRVHRRLIDIDMAAVAAGDNPSLPAQGWVTLGTMQRLPVVVENAAFRLQSETESGGFGRIARSQADVLDGLVRPHLGAPLYWQNQGHWTPLAPGGRLWIRPWGREERWLIPLAEVQRVTQWRPEAQRAWVAIDYLSVAEAYPSMSYLINQP